MKENYVTIFDSGFLPQGLALYHSLLSIEEEFHLWVLCLDKDCIQTLDQLDLKHISCLDISTYEDKKLLQIKSERTKSEYCWTLTPLAMEWVLEKATELQRITYIDADIFFVKSPRRLFLELENSGKSVLITKHAYSPENDKSYHSGIFCVQFLPITRGQGEKVLHWWRDQCIDWCFARSEDGKFGDQKYLEEWPKLFNDIVHILEPDNLALGPWNISRYPYSDAIFYHFHGLRIVNLNRFYLSGYTIPKPAIEHLYKPYINLLKRSIEIASKHGFQFKPQKKNETLFILLIKHIYRIIRLLNSKIFTPYYIEM